MVRLDICQPAKSSWYSVFADESRNHCPGRISACASSTSAGMVLVDIDGRPPPPVGEA
jgi:hypothetical protein